MDATPLEQLAASLAQACAADQATRTRERCTLALQNKLAPTTPQAPPCGLFAQEQTTLFPTQTERTI